MKVIEYTKPTADAIMRAQNAPLNVGNNKKIQNKISNVSGDTYMGMFKIDYVISDVGGEESNNYYVITGGKAVVNNITFSVDGIEGTMGAYIWLECEYGTDAPIQPFITYGSSFPSSGLEKAKILLATIEDGIPVQQHHGAVYAFILGECPEEEE